MTHDGTQHDGAGSPYIDAGGLPAGQIDEGGKYIGVPDDYAVVKSYETPWEQHWYGGATAASMPQYQTGDEFAPIAAPEQIPTLQFALVEAGLLDPDNVRLGVWDNTSVTAYRNLLGVANRYGIDYQQALALLGNNPSAAQLRRLRGPAGPTTVIRLAHPDDLAAVANEVAPRTIGRRLTDDEVRKFIGAYQSSQRAQNAGSPEVAAEVAATQADPTAAGARDLVDVYSSFLKMIVGGGSGG